LPAKIEIADNDPRRPQLFEIDAAKICKRPSRLVRSARSVEEISIQIQFDPFGIRAGLPE
jgi:hypothetical protein